MSKIITGSAIVGGVSTMRDGTLKVTLHAQEMESENAGKLVAMNNQHCVFVLSGNELSKDQMKAIKDVDVAPIEGKKPSQRLRATLRVAWEKNPQGFNDSESYYQWRMEQFITDVKSEFTEE